MHPETILEFPREDVNQPFGAENWNRFNANWHNGFQAIQSTPVDDAGVVLVGQYPETGTTRVTLTDRAVFNKGGTIVLTGNTTLTGTLGVTGNTTITGTFGVTGNTTLTGDLATTGNVTLGNNIADTVTIAGTLGVTGLTTLTSLTATGPAFILGDANSDTLVVNAIATFKNLAGNVQLFTDPSNNQTIVGRATPVTGSNIANSFQVVGTTHLGPTAATDTALFLYRSAAATTGWTLGVGSSPNLLFKDDGAVTVLSLNDSADTYQAVLTGSLHVDGTDSLIDGNLAVNGDLAHDGGDFGVFGALTSQATIGADATDPATTMSLVNEIRGILIDFGFAS